MVRDSLRPLLTHLVHHHPQLQKAADYVQQAFVANAPRQTGHQDVMIPSVRWYAKRIETPD